MAGPWTRSEQKLCHLYRIHFVDREKRDLTEKDRTYKPGDQLVANFHVRAAKPGPYQPKLTITGPAPVETRLGKPMTFKVGNFDEFHSGLILINIPAQAGAYVLRLELECGSERAFWETDIQVQKL